MRSRHPCCWPSKPKRLRRPCGWRCECSKNEKTCSIRWPIRAIEDSPARPPNEPRNLKSTLRGSEPFCYRAKNRRAVAPEGRPPRSIDTSSEQVGLSVVVNIQFSLSAHHG